MDNYFDKINTDGIANKKLSQVQSRVCSFCNSYKYPKCKIRNAKTSPNLNAETCPYFDERKCFDEW